LTKWQLDLKVQLFSIVTGMPLVYQSFARGLCDEKKTH
jgi:hypothetical protein